MSDVITDNQRELDLLILAQKLTGYDQEPTSDREQGRDWPQSSSALSMIGLLRMQNIKSCIEGVIRRGINGDVMECGVWRGGASIYMKAILNAHGSSRRVWLADSFEGIPKNEMRQCIEDRNVDFAPHDYIAVSLEQVKENFEKYGLMDERVQFVKGWFNQTLHKVQTGPLAVLRLDGDMYESTLDCLNALYDRVSEGGYLIIDDYALPTCKKAVDEFRAYRAIKTPISKIDWTGIYWRKDVKSHDKQERLERVSN